MRAILSENSTIYALSSGHGRAGVALVRISGSRAAEAARQLGIGPLKPRVARLARLTHPVTGAWLDQALVLQFVAPASFTGEDVIELQLHGGRAVVTAVLGALGSIGGLRHARPGEFTERAFENGKLDLAQVESLADLIDSDTEQQRLQALKGLEGSLGQNVAQWREQLLTIRALIAAQIDFSDEGDVSDTDADEIDSLLQQLLSELEAAARAFQARRVIADGLRVAIVGAPNSGKSSLLNALAGSDVAIVSEVPGTTRDVIEVRLDLEGYAVVLFDTAGFRVTTDPVEQLGIERAHATMRRADCTLHLCESDRWDLDGLMADRLIRIRSKVDQGAGPSASLNHDVLCISSVTGAGLVGLRAKLLAEAQLHQVDKEAPLVVRPRQMEAILSAIEQVRQARASLDAGIEVADQCVGSSMRALSRIVGEIDVEDVLGDIFSRFCIGK